MDGKRSVWKVEGSAKKKGRPDADVGKAMDPEKLVVEFAPI